MKKALFFTFAFGLVVLGAGYVLTSERGDSPKSQAYCPVMGGEINKSIFTDMDGKRIYFCCSNCIGEFKKEPEKYLKKLEAQGVVLAKVPSSGKCCSGSKEKESTSPCGNQKTCPMSGMKVNKDIFADFEGERVFFCGPGCREKFMEDPASSIKKLEAQGVILERVEKGSSGQGKKK